jgi:hypothetical protein
MSLYKIERRDNGKSNTVNDYWNASMVHDILVERDIPCRFSEVEGQ